MEYNEEEQEEVKLDFFNFSINGYPIMDDTLFGQPFMTTLKDVDLLSDDFASDIIEKYSICKYLFDSSNGFLIKDFAYRVKKDDPTTIVCRPLLLGALIGAVVWIPDNKSYYDLSQSYLDFDLTTIYGTTGDDINFFNRMGQWDMNNNCNEISLKDGQGINGLFIPSLNNLIYSENSIYLYQYFSHDENLIYCYNGRYPLQDTGWGASADYIPLSDGDNIDVAFFHNWSFYKNNKSGFLIPATRRIEPMSNEDIFGIKIMLNHVTEDGIDNLSIIEDLSDYQVLFYNAYAPDIDIDTWEYEIQGDTIVIKANGGKNIHPPTYIAVIPPKAGTDECYQAPAIFSYGYFNI